MRLQTLSKIILILSFSTSAAWAAETKEFECNPTGAAEMNRFNATGSISTTDKNAATAEIKLNMQKAGINTPVSDEANLSLTGTSRVYAAGSLGANEVTLVQLSGELKGQVYNLKITQGLTGPFSILTVQGVPYRAQCNFK